MSLTFAIDNVLETFVVFKLTLNKGYDQIFVSFWKHQVVKWFLVPVNITNSINFEGAPTAIAKAEAMDSIVT